MSETMMTEAATPTEGETASVSADHAATVASEAGQEQAAPEGQATDAVTTEGDPAKPQGAPENYEFKAAEGQAFDPAVLTQFSEVAKELNLSQDAAQKVLDKMAPALQARQQAALETARNQWAEAARADQEFGGNQLNENLAVAKKAMDAFASPELRALLNESGLGNHPEMIRVFYRAGKAISEDGRLVTGARGEIAANDPAKRLFPNQS